MPLVATAQGGFIHYEAIGAGPPLVLIHGWAMSGRAWRLLDGLAERYRLIMPDLRGHGLSSAPDSGYSYEDFSGDLVTLFQSLRLDNAVVVGWSMGVQIALHASPLLKERLSALVFVSGTPCFTAVDGYPHGLHSVETKGMALRLKRDYVGTIRDFSERMFVAGELCQEERERIAFEVTCVPPACHALQQSLATLAASDLRHALSSINLPVLLIHGSADTICLPAASRYMAEQLPEAHLIEMEEVGHAPFLSHPGEFKTILTEFLDGIFANDRQM